MFSVALEKKTALCDLARVSTESQRAALVDVIALAGHEVDDLVGALLVELTGVRIGNA